MLRAILLYLSGAKWAQALVTTFGKRAARRFVAGETMPEALAVTQKLNQQGFWVTLDYLGESITRAKETRQVVETYRDLLEQIHTQNLQAGISLKLTALGLDISEELCLVNLRMIVDIARNYRIPVAIDMESSHYTETTLRVFRAARDACSYDNLGVAIQAYLFRSEKDMGELASEGAQVRLCKGAYLESPSKAIPEKSGVDANFIKLMDQFLRAAPPAYLGIATHDDQMINAAVATIRDHHIPKERFEFQMLYGIRPTRQLELITMGYPTRIYVPFGEAWYPYFMRRLAERPANLWFILKNLFKG